MIKKTISKTKNILSKAHPSVYYGLFAVLVAGFFLVPIKSAHAWSLAGFAVDSIANLFQGFLWIIYYLFVVVMGWIGDNMFKVVLWVGDFRGFTNHPSVISGWVLMRDFANLLFIPFLLIIAFGTLLKIESYSYKKLLPKVILAAVFVNFSRVFCGLIVDATEIVMLTFSAAIVDAGHAGFYTAFKMDELLDLSSETNANTFSTTINDQKSSGWTETDYILAIIVAGVMITLVAFLMITAAAVLIARIVAIWILTIISPLAVAALVLPSTQKYFNQWLSTFVQQAAVGPIFFFFLWLSLRFILVDSGGDVLAGIGGAANIPSTGAAADALKPDILVSWAIAFGFLVISLKITESMSSATKEITGKVIGWTKDKALGAAKVLSGATLLGGAAAMGAGAWWAYTKKGAKDSAGLHADSARANFKKRWGVDPVAIATLGFGGKSFEERRKGKQKDIDFANLTGEKKALEAMMNSQSGFKSWWMGKFGATAAHARFGGYSKSKDRAEYNREIAKLEAQINALTDENSAYGKQKNQLGKERTKAMKEADSKIKESQKEAENTDGAIKVLNQILGELKKDSTYDPSDLLRSIEDTPIGRLLMEKGVKAGAKLKQSEFKTKLNDFSKEKNNHETAIGKQMQAKEEAEKDYREKIEELNTDKEYTDANGKTVAELKAKLAAVPVPIQIPELQAAIRAAASKGTEEVNSDNEMYLRRHLFGLLTDGRTEEALTLLPHFAKVGHVNEWMKEINDRLSAVGVADKDLFDISHEGAAEMAQALFVKGGDSKGLMKKIGINNAGMSAQEVMPYMNLLSENAVQQGHFSFGWGYDTDAMGKLVARNKRDQNLMVSVEASKFGVEKSLRQGNHLQWGYYQNGGKDWAMSAGMMHMLIEGADSTVVEGMKRGRITVGTNLKRSLRSNRKQAALLYKKAMEAGNKDLADYVNNILVPGISKQVDTLVQAGDAEEKELSEMFDYINTNHAPDYASQQAA